MRTGLYPIGLGRAHFPIKADSMSATQIARTRTSDSVIAGFGARARQALWAMFILLPSILAATYYGLIASDRYVSEARFVIHTASKPNGALGGLTALLQLAGLERSQDDAFAVRDYLTSRDGLRELNARLPLRPRYGVADADFAARFPSLLYGPSDEALFRYFSTMVTAVVNTTSGLTTLRVQAFRAEDAHQIARTLLDLGEEQVNRLNVRIQQDALHLAATELARAEERRITTQIAVTAFRARELTLDPTKESAGIIGMIGRLSSELADARMAVDQTRASSPNSPQLLSQQQRVDAINRQIELQRLQVAGDANGLADKIERYERLLLEDEFAIRALAQTTIAMESARIEARRQQLFLERVVEPGLPDEAIMPQRWASIGTVFGFNIIGGLIIFLLVTGVREHAAGSRRQR
jgi:capsular polysaccharide transport system permease protein